LVSMLTKEVANALATLRASASFAPNSGSGIPRDYLGSVNSRNVITRNRRGEPDNATLEHGKVSLGEDARRGKRKHGFNSSTS
jgi:hypothetical protein